VVVTRGRLRKLIAAGLVDSFGLALGWTVFVLHAVATQGLVAVGIYNAAMLVGVGLSAPAAGWLAARLDGKLLLQSTAVVEATLRVATFALLLLDLPLVLVAGLVTLTNVTAWTGYAGMRAEVAAVAVGRRARALTWYVGGIAAVEAAGAATAAVLPVGDRGTVTGSLLLVVIGFYAACLLPTIVVARGSCVPRSRRLVDASRLLRRAPALGGGFVVMLLASGPTFLAVALAAELHGRLWVAPAAVAFTLGALLAPAVVGAVERHSTPSFVSWPLLGVGIVAGWAAAPWDPAGLLVAQLLSGVFMTALEGTIDARVADDAEDELTAGLGWAASTRALGSAAAVGAAPALIAIGGVGAVSALAGAVLATMALAGLMRAALVAELPRVSRPVRAEATGEGRR